MWITYVGKLDKGKERKGKERKEKKQRVKKFQQSNKLSEIRKEKKKGGVLFTFVSTAEDGSELTN